MNRVGFHWAKLCGNERNLCAMSLSWGDLLSDLEGRSVSIVGNARAVRG